MESLVKIIYVAVGGAAGAVARHLITISPLANVFERFPLPTLLINVSGSFLIGLMFAAFNERMPASENLRLGLMVGFVGAFTTFSTFELELYELMKGRSFAGAAAYVILSLVCGFAALLSGMALGRRF